MNRALYTCATSKAAGTKKLFHYGLNVPYYTHFTSPIRRYPDIIVHRQLEALINTKSNSPYNHEKIFNIVKQSNLTKINARKAQEKSIKLYLIYHLNEYMKLHKKDYIIEEALVVGFYNYDIEFYIPRFTFDNKISLRDLRDKGIIEEIQIVQERNLQDNVDNVFEVYWDNNISIDNIMSKLKKIKKHTSNNNENDCDSDNDSNSSNSSRSSNDNNNSNDDNESERIKERINNIKQHLKNCHKQSLKIFDKFKVIVIPDFAKEEIYVYLAPPEFDDYDVSKNNYNLSSNENDNTIKYEPENSFD